MKKTPPLQIAFLDVGHGDTIVISFIEDGIKKGIIIDCNDPIKTKNYIIKNNIQVIDYILITHLHLDHYRGVNSLIDILRKNEIEVNTICWEKDRYLREDESEKKNYRTFTAMLEENHINNGIGYMSKRFDSNNYKSLESGNIKDLSINIVYPNSFVANYFDDKNVNNTSTVVKIDFKDFRIVLPGDLEGEGWYMLEQYLPDLNSDILKSPHHGGSFESGDKSLSVEEVIDLVNPKYMVISTGQNDKYRHPSKKTIEYSTCKNIKVLCTQATSLCDINRLEKKEYIISKLKNGNKGSKNSCPCVGDIVFELDEDIKIISPEVSAINDIKSKLTNRLCLNL
ncbi:ComEC/Rec2 family competence protein [Paraclostridium bifermentans]|uniref:ComEC/Rec2 family competence protein n=1 Tax=Paraclostridium bifermentans TaxID=1490 RepID=UPI00040B58BC|nr:MBL fold metallo-hydrolase [Paraclostridium bifermentans]